MKEVTSNWEYTTYNHTHFEADLPGDVVEVTLQVKTVRGMHKIKKDAWGAHQHSYKIWGSQIAPNPTTTKQIKRFQTQWREYQQRRDQQARRRSGYSFSHPPLDITTPQVLKKRGYQTPSPVAEPLSSMALLSAGMLPLGPRKQPSAAMGRTYMGDTPAIASTSTDSSANTPQTMDTPTPPLLLDLRMKKEEDNQKEHPGQDPPPIVICPVSSEEDNIPELISEPTKMKEEKSEGLTPQIVRVESITEEEYNKREPRGDTPRPQHVKFIEAPASPPPQDRKEEEMDTQENQSTDFSPEDKNSHGPALEVKVYTKGSNSEEESKEERKQNRSEAWAKRRIQAQKKRLILKIKRNTLGPANLEVCRVPPTPEEAPACLFPEPASSPKEGPPYEY